MSALHDASLTPPERDALAGEYVLGLLDGADCEAAGHRLDTDCDFAASVERWRRHFFALDAAATPIVPSASLWSQIEASLTSAAAPARTVPSSAATASRLAEWWNSLFVWRGAAFAGALATILLAAGLFGALDRAGRQPLMVAVLLTEGNAAAAVVNTFADGRVEMLPLQSIDVPAGKALEIWTLWDRAVGPRSVGLIDRARSTPLRLDNLPLGNGQLFEITLEPASGSPTGRPTGPIIAKGTTSQRL
ncbi:anti-sigma factor [Bosea sp. (in: a-proteobacteria)]|jgi:anti-sigma-K factor RskA|uniref:anti-sigma factor n=1 Tax=Bosea sp. (in: a-proteobacteria) TaxID=1871050 RepID=UPI002DDCEBE6|nr:anti-sigma factor [Bosea sp. (in: a-proteobacteria)]HEV2509418.1 anti-sigma factor [Bosea sp. (in: a-proteobacteria)]